MIYEVNLSRHFDLDAFDDENCRIVNGPSCRSVVILVMESLLGIKSIFKNTDMTAYG